MTESKSKKQNKQSIRRSQKSKSKGSRSKLQNINRQKITFQDIYEDLIQTKQKIERVPLTKPQPFQFSMVQLQKNINSETSEQVKLKYRFNAYLLDLISSTQTNIQDQETNECVIIQNARSCSPQQLLTSINNQIQCLKQLKQEDKGKSKSTKRKFKVSSNNKKSKKQPYDDPVEQAKIKLQIEKLNQYQNIRASKFQLYEDVAQQQEQKTIDEKQKGQKQSSVSTPKKKNKIQKMVANWQYQSRHLKQRRLQIKSRFRNPENDEVDQTQLSQWQRDMRPVFKKLLGEKFNNYWLDIKQEKIQFQEYYQKKEIKKQQEICQKHLYKKQNQQPSLQLGDEHQRNEESQEHSQQVRQRNFDSIFDDNNEHNEDDFLGYPFKSAYDDQYDNNPFFGQNQNYF